MLVYGRQEYEERLGALLQHLAWRAESIRADCLDELRALLIQSGQLEQGVEDCQEQALAAGGQRAGFEPRLLEGVRRLTEQAAGLFLRAWRDSNPGLALPPVERTATLGDFTAAVRGMQGGADAVLTLKIPEGFEYYALFPEQYGLSALRWAADHAGTSPKRVAVVGIRSIGTSLSALVAVVLSRLGWQVQRRTVRPTGHPFAREVKLGDAGLEGCACGLVVDEGPGLSGSSMGAAAQALTKVGVCDIAFLPGHGGEPGSAANPETRRWWAQTRRYVTELAELRWNGRALTESLTARTRELSDVGGAVRVEDVSGGLWRKQAFSKEAEWPAALARFERTKFLCSTGNKGAMLWKFAGLGCCWQGGKTSLELGLEEMVGREKLGLVPPVLGSAHGFAATPWIEGRRLGMQDLQAKAALAHAGRYLLESAGPPLGAGEAAAALARLKEMLLANAGEALGDAATERIRGWADGIRAEASAASYCDGRMAPYEWVRTPGGGLLKTDVFGHDRDHTLVGKQPLLWDVAGVLVEATIGAEAAAPLLCPLAAAGIQVHRNALTFYQMAYAAFRLGMTTLCAGELPPQDEERNRLRTAAAAYRSKLEQLRQGIQEPRD